jgi:hypothetical protein
MHPLVLFSIEAPEIYFGSSYFEQLLLDGATIDMAVDGSVTPVDYTYTVPTDQRIRVSRMVFSVEDGNAKFDAADFGQIGGGLSNGVEISNTPDGGSPDILTNWKNNRDMRHSMPFFQQQSEQIGQGGEYIGVWPISDILSGGKGLYLNDGDTFTVTVQDDLTPLSFMSGRILGRIINV